LVTYRAAMSLKPDVKSGEGTLIGVEMSGFAQWSIDGRGPVCLEGLPDWDAEG
jgi:hypothetical protein